MSSNHKASREAYAREHGLSAQQMCERVHYSRINAEMRRWQDSFNKLVIKGVFLIADDWHLGRRIC